MEGMNWKLKGCHTIKQCSVDRLSSLPLELLSRILSLLPTKDVAALQVLSKTMLRLHVFSLITSVDLDADFDHPCFDDRFPLFVSFVDHLLHQLSRFGHHPLSRFRLHLAGEDLIENQRTLYDFHSDAFPCLPPSRLSSWLSFPLSLPGLRELDLRFTLSNPSSHHLPPRLFVSTSLEVLKLHSNLKLDGALISLVSLPNLKLLHLHSLFIVDDAFIPRLVSTCPSLEDLSITYCWWALSERLSISSHSLKRLTLFIPRSDEVKNGDLVVFDTPNLEYFYYDDNLAYRYSVTTMNALVQATFIVGSPLADGSEENNLRQQLTLVRMLSNAKSLTLLGGFMENIHYGGEFKDQLPVFHNLKTLELDSNILSGRWDIILMQILVCMPNLETLVFPMGLFDTKNKNKLEDMGLDLFTETTPQCLLTHLKQIVIEMFVGGALELTIIKYFLKEALILQDLVVVYKSELTPPHDHRLLLERTLKEIPRASITCSIQVS